MVVFEGDIGVEATAATLAREIGATRLTRCYLYISLPKAAVRTKSNDGGP